MDDVSVTMFNTVDPRDPNQFDPEHNQMIVEDCKNLFGSILSILKKFMIDCHFSSINKPSHSKCIDSIATEIVIRHTNPQHYSQQCP